MDPVFLSSLSPASNADPVSKASQSIGSTQSVDDGLGLSFSEVLSQSATGFADTVRKAEATSVAGLKGEAGAYEVAMSVMEAEQQLRVATAIRDRVIQAFQELSRMQI